MTGTGLTCLLDKSALARIGSESVARALEPLIIGRTVAVCAIVRLEVLHTARGPNDYVSLEGDLRDAFLTLPVGAEVCARALRVQGLLAERSRHADVGAPKLIVAACAEVHGATVLHYDRDYDLISEVTGQPASWVVPAGSVP
ncbi:PIN domain nuclease [Streptosporangium sp. KLBMP 9127]|nr:PIN domain nuclease [Streptosporangium sp. KLBMP 9127]